METSVRTEKWINERRNSFIFPKKNENNNTASEPIVLNKNILKSTGYTMDLDPTYVSSSPNSDLFILNLKKRIDGYYLVK